jgi:RNA polymerase sigma-70 factor (ECF subfamily)
VENVLAQPRFASDEETLVARFRAGEEGAFDAIVREHRRAVYMMARRLLPTHEDADEAAQVAFVRAWQARSRFRGDSSIRTWLIRIAINTARSMRAARSGAAGTEPFDDPSVPERIPDRTMGSDERLRRRQMRARVRRAVAALPGRQREAVLLKVFSELTYREAAALMRLSEGAVKAHLHQAVSNLRRWMSRETDGEGR